MLQLSVEDDVSLIFDSPQAATLPDRSSHRWRSRESQAEGLDLIEVEIGLISVPI
jgi:hypothetical protein